MTKLHDEKEKKALRARLARIEGQLRGLQRSLDLETDYELMAQQLSEARKALDKAFFVLIGCAIAQDEATREQALTLLHKYA